jgi:flagellar hook assembly protein FlgD
MPDSARINYLEMIVDFFGLYDSAVGIEVNADTANSRLLAYPNPFTDRVTFVAQGISGSATIQIFNRHGRMVFTKQIVPPTGNSPEICFTWDGRSLSGKILPKGVYIASLTNGNRSYVAKIVRF